MLEGVGLVEKRLKNRIQWVGDSLAKNDALELLQAQEANLDFWTLEMEKKIDELIQNNKEYAYLTYDDVQNMHGNQKTMIAVNSPPGTTIEMNSLTPSEQEINLYSESGDILVHFFSQ